MFYQKFHIQCARFLLPCRYSNCHSLIHHLQFQVFSSIMDMNLLSKSPLNSMSPSSWCCSTARKSICSGGLSFRSLFQVFEQNLAEFILIHLYQEMLQGMLTLLFLAQCPPVSVKLWAQLFCESTVHICRVFFLTKACFIRIFPWHRVILGFCSIFQSSHCACAPLMFGHLSSLSLIASEKLLVF